VKIREVWRGEFGGGEFGVDETIATINQLAWGMELSAWR